MTAQAFSEITISCGASLDVSLILQNSHWPARSNPIHLTQKYMYLVFERRNCQRCTVIHTMQDYLTT